MPWPPASHRCGSSTWYPGVDVDDGVRRPEVERPPPQLGVARPVELAWDRGDRRDVYGVLGQRPVGDGAREVDVDRLGDTHHRAVERVEGRRREDRLSDVRRRVLAGGRALRNRRRRPTGARANGSAGRRRRRQRVDGAAAPAGRRAAAARQRVDRRGGSSQRVDGRRRPAGRSGGGAGCSAGGASTAAGSGLTSGSAQAVGPPMASPPTSPAATIAVAILRKMRCGMRHLQIQNSIQCRTTRRPAFASEARPRPPDHPADYRPELRCCSLSACGLLLAPHRTVRGW